MARRHGPLAQHNPWRGIAIHVCWGLTAATIVFGFIVLPIAERPDGRTAWSAVCRAFGVASQQPVEAQVTRAYASTVSWTPQTLADATSGDPRHGASVAMVCQACHGEKGVNDSAWIPNLAGMRPETTVKQLADYKSGSRSWPVMNAIATVLADTDVRDVAAFYGSLMPAAAVESGWGTIVVPNDAATDPTLRLVFAGDPKRGIAPCASCHGLGGSKRAAPVLAGQQASYVARQLVAFRTRIRSNDEGEQMRVVAAHLTDEEIRLLASYLGYGRNPCRVDPVGCKVQERLPEVER